MGNNNGLDVNVSPYLIQNMKKNLGTTNPLNATPIKSPTKVEIYDYTFTPQHNPLRNKMWYEVPPKITDKKIGTTPEKVPKIEKNLIDVYTEKPSKIPKNTSAQKMNTIMTNQRKELSTYQTNYVVKPTQKVLAKEYTQLNNLYKQTRDPNIKMQLDALKSQMTHGQKMNLKKQQAKIASTKTKNYSNPNFPQYDPNNTHHKKFLQESTKKSRQQIINEKKAAEAQKAGKVVQKYFIGTPKTLTARDLLEGY